MITLEVGKEIDSKVHHFIEDLVQEYGLMV